jgi:hypothetical protein
MLAKSEKYIINFPNPLNHPIYLWFVLWSLVRPHSLYIYMAFWQIETNVEMGLKSGKTTMDGIGIFCFGKCISKFSTQFFSLLKNTIHKYTFTEEGLWVYISREYRIKFITIKKFGFFHFKLLLV